MSIGLGPHGTAPILYMLAAVVKNRGLTRAFFLIYNNTVSHSRSLCQAQPESDIKRTPEVFY